MSDRENIKIALAQISPKIGDIEDNLQKHLHLIDRAKQKSVNVIVFPELSLSGYLLRDGVFDIAISKEDDRLKSFLDNSYGITILLGLVELSDDFKLYNSFFVFEDGKLIHIHRKIYLPTYSVFEEKRFFAEGDKVRSFQSKWGTFGVLICNDMWHPTLLWLLSLQNSELVFVPAAAPLRGLKENKISDSQRIWKLLCECGAKTNTLYIAFANQIGWQDQLYFFGESALYGPDGSLIHQASSDKEDLLLVDVDFQFLKRERIVTPLRRDERVELIARELHFLRTISN
ncbi:MAG: hypothetical protein N2450_03440 [bacterium]|nr:hypothetical protein [bacterium]